MSQEKSCPNCGAEYKSGIMGSIQPLSKNKLQIIKVYNSTQSESYCSKCGKDLYVKSKIKIQDEIKDLQKTLKNSMDAVPVVTTHMPQNWEFDVIHMVTGQSTIGTGVVSEFASSWTDFFGAQSGFYNSKLRGGENICLAQIRKQTLELGGNAVIATDVDYSELGSLKGMIMVCISGTAIKLKNTSILGGNRPEKIERIVRLNDRLQYLESFYIED